MWHFPQQTATLQGVALQYFCASYHYLQYLFATCPVPVQHATEPAHAAAFMQVVSDYLTAYDGEQRFVQAMNRPVAMVSYEDV